MSAHDRKNSYASYHSFLEEDKYLDDDLGDVANINLDAIFDLPEETMPTLTTSTHLQSSPTHNPKQPSPISSGSALSKDDAGIFEFSNSLNDLFEDETNVEQEPIKINYFSRGSVASMATFHTAIERKYVEPSAAVVQEVVSESPEVQTVDFALYRQDTQDPQDPQDAPRQELLNDEGEAWNETRRLNDLGDEEDEEDEEAEDEANEISLDIEPSTTSRLSTIDGGGLMPLEMGIKRKSSFKKSNLFRPLSFAYQKASHSFATLTSKAAATRDPSVESVPTPKPIVSASPTGQSDAQPTYPLSTPSFPPPNPWPLALTPVSRPCAELAQEAQRLKTKRYFEGFLYKSDPAAPCFRAYYVELVGAHLHFFPTPLPPPETRARGKPSLVVPVLDCKLVVLDQCLLLKFVDSAIVVKAPADDLPTWTLLLQLAMHETASLCIQATLPAFARENGPASTYEGVLQICFPGQEWLRVTCEISKARDGFQEVKKKKKKKKKDQERSLDHCDRAVVRFFLLDKKKTLFATLCNVFQAFFVYPSEVLGRINGTLFLQKQEETSPFVLLMGNEIPEILHTLWHVFELSAPPRGDLSLSELPPPTQPLLDPDDAYDLFQQCIARQLDNTAVAGQAVGDAAVGEAPDLSSPSPDDSETRAVPEIDLDSPAAGDKEAPLRPLSIFPIDPMRSKKLSVLRPISLMPDSAGPLRGSVFSTLEPDSARDFDLGDTLAPADDSSGHIDDAEYAEENAATPRAQAAGDVSMRPISVMPEDGRASPGPDAPPAGQKRTSVAPNLRPLSIAPDHRASILPSLRPLSIMPDHRMSMLPSVRPLSMMPEPSDDITPTSGPQSTTSQRPPERAIPPPSPPSPSLQPMLQMKLQEQERMLREQQAAAMAAAAARQQRKLEDQQAYASKYIQNLMAEPKGYTESTHVDLQESTQPKLGLHGLLPEPVNFLEDEEEDMAGFDDDEDDDDDAGSGGYTSEEDGEGDDDDDFDRETTVTYAMPTNRAKEEEDEEIVPKFVEFGGLLARPQVPLKQQETLQQRQKFYAQLQVEQKKRKEEQQMKARELQHEQAKRRLEQERQLQQTKEREAAMQRGMAGPSPRMGGASAARGQVAGRGRGGGAEQERQIRERQEERKRVESFYGGDRRGAAPGRGGTGAKHVDSDDSDSSDEDASTGSSSDEEVKNVAPRPRAPVPRGAPPPSTPPQQQHRRPGVPTPPASRPTLSPRGPGMPDLNKRMPRPPVSPTPSQQPIRMPRPATPTSRSSTASTLSQRPIRPRPAVSHISVDDPRLSVSSDVSRARPRRPRPTGN